MMIMRLWGNLALKKCVNDKETYPMTAIELTIWLLILMCGMLLVLWPLKGGARKKWGVQMQVNSSKAIIAFSF